jgi:uncharacterized membrane protein
MTNRLKGLDYFRGVIILLMIALHLLFELFHYDTLLISFLDFVTFGFIMLIGITVTYHYTNKFQNKSFKESFIYFFKRSFKIYLAYLVFTLFYFFTLHQNIGPLSILRAIALLDLNYNTLILIPIAFYILLIPEIIYLLKKGIKSIYLVLLGIVIYFISLYINYLPFDSSFRFLKSIFFGHSDWLNFPIFQWFIVFLIGVWVGEYLIKNKDPSNYILKNGFIFLVLFIIILSAMIYFNKDINITHTKFPLTPYHFIYSLACCFILLGVFLKLNTINIPFLEGFGQNSLIAYIGHWVLIRLTLFFELTSFIHPIILSIIIISLVYGLCKLNYKLKLL